ncbi:nucleoside hydrolase, partial [Streptomyces pilosus]
AGAAGARRAGGARGAGADPEGLTTHRLPVEVSLAPGPARGQTVVDRRPRAGESELHEGVREQPLVDVGLDVDVERYVRLYLTTVERPAV